MLNEAQNSLTILSMRRKQINVSHHAMVNLWKFRLCGCTAKNQTVTDDVVDISRCFKEYNEIYLFIYAFFIEGYKCFSVSALLSKPALI